MATNNTNLNNSAITKLAAALSKMKTDSDFADLTVTCGDKKWEVHSAVLAVRSPFFKKAISTNMAEKLDMKIDIKELDSETMEEVINFMYGIGIGKAPIRSLLEAGERFQMDDLKEDAIKLAKNIMSVENVIEIGQLAEMYSLGDILDECAQVIVKSGVPMKEDDLSPKLAAMVIRILQENLKDSQEKLKAIYCCNLCGVKFSSERIKEEHLSGRKHAKELAKFESS